MQTLPIPQPHTHVALREGVQMAIKDVANAGHQEFLFKKNFIALKRRLKNTIWYILISGEIEVGYTNSGEELASLGSICERLLTTIGQSLT